jgi:hypothetical protein
MHCQLERSWANRGAYHYSRKGGVVVRVDVGAGAERASVYQRRDGGGAMRSDDVYAWRRTPLPPRPSLPVP